MTSKSLEALQWYHGLMIHNLLFLPSDFMHHRRGTKLLRQPPEMREVLPPINIYKDKLGGNHLYHKMLCNNHRGEARYNMIQTGVVLRHDSRCHQPQTRGMIQKQVGQMKIPVQHIPCQMPPHSCNDPNQLDPADRHRQLHRGLGPRPSRPPTMPVLQGKLSTQKTSLSVPYNDCYKIYYIGRLHNRTPR